MIHQRPSGWLARGRPATCNHDDAASTVAPVAGRERAQRVQSYVDGRRGGGRRQCIPRALHAACLSGASGTPPLTVTALDRKSEAAAFISRRGSSRHGFLFYSSGLYGKQPVDTAPRGPSSRSVSGQASPEPGRRERAWGDGPWARPSRHVYASSKPQAWASGGSPAKSEAEPPLCSGWLRPLRIGAC